MQSFIRVMKALSDPNRVKIVKMLGRREMCVCEVTAALGLAQPTVSRHLKLLEEAGLVSRRKEGLWVNYLIAGDGANPFVAAMLAGLNTWLNQDSKIESLLAKVPNLRREEICCKK
jgi:ArsR family transcriptional regulator, arsenate/arsenite/antimonite-responsive transcriptional repressor